jgi:hypothetical protein
MTAEAPGPATDDEQAAVSRQQPDAMTLVIPSNPSAQYSSSPRR